MKARDENENERKTGDDEECFCAYDESRR